MNHLYSALVPFCLAASLSACSLQPFGPQAKMTVVIDPSRWERGPDLADELLRGPSALSAPASTAGFHCFAVNIMGPGIANSDSQSGGTSGVYSPPTSYCSYAGVTSPPILGAGTPHEVNLNVPTGTGRIVQLVGILRGNTTICSFNGPVGSHTTSGFSTDEYYELGHSVVDIFGATTVSIANNYVQSDTRRLDCGGQVLPLSAARAPTGLGCVGGLGSIATGVAISPDNYSVDDGTASVSGCSTAAGIKYQEFEFDTAGVSGLANYRSITVGWKGRAGQKPTACAATDDPTLGTGAPALYIWNNVTPGWFAISSSTSSGGVEVINGGTGTVSISDYIASGKIYIAVKGGVVAANDCSLVHTDFIGLKLQK